MVIIKIYKDKIKPAVKAGIDVWTKQDSIYSKKYLKNMNFEIGTVCLNSYNDVNYINYFIKQNKKFISEVDITGIKDIISAVELGDIKYVCNRNKIKLVPDIGVPVPEFYGMFYGKKTKIISSEDGYTGFIEQDGKPYIDENGYMYYQIFYNKKTHDYFQVVNKLLYDGLETNVAYVLFIAAGIKFPLMNLNSQAKDIISEYAMSENEIEYLFGLIDQIIPDLELDVQDEEDGSNIVIKDRRFTLLPIASQHNIIYMIQLINSFSE